MERNKKLIIIALACSLMLVLGANVLFALTVYPVTRFGDIALYNERNDTEMTSASVLGVQAGDFIVAWLRDDISTSYQPTDVDGLTAKLYLDDDTASGQWIEDGRDRETYAGSYRWWFDLDQCLEGSFTYFITYFAIMDPEIIVDGDSFKFQVKNTAAPEYDPVKITVEPNATISYVVDESPAFLTWRFTYAGSCVGIVTLDGVEVDTQTYPASSVENAFTYIVDTSVEGSQDIIFKVIPDDGSPSVSDAVTVDIGIVTTGTDTTTPTDPTTPTDTPTDTEPTDIPVVDNILVIMAAAGIGIMIVFLVWRRR